MLQQPGQDDHDGDLELDLPGTDAGGGAHEDDCRPLDDAKEQVGYELFDWEPDELDELDDVLHELDLPHEWVSEGYEVVVHAEDEERVDGLLPAIRYPDELPPEEDSGDDTDAQVLSALYLAADRMHAEPTADATGPFLDAAERIGERAPYGVDEGEWDAVVELVDELIDAFQAAAPPAAIAELALRLRSRLRPLV